MEFEPSLVPAGINYAASAQPSRPTTELPPIQQSKYTREQSNRVRHVNTFGYNNMPNRSNSIPDIESMAIINQNRPYEPGMPMVLIGLNTNSGDCRNIAPYFLQIHKKFQRIYFLLVSYQPYDNIINTFANIPELLQLNVSHDAHGSFKAFLAQMNKLSIPHVFIFNLSRTLIWDGHPQSMALGTNLMRLNGQVAIHNNMRAVSPSRVQEWRARGMSPQRCRSVATTWRSDEELYASKSIAELKTMRLE
ncbi:putative FixW protein [Spironucleus salmonicida]|uniref:FixW protein n=1 Tax=Spironucleus salmonicida TaxID=348837 RepID=V6LPE0_9EUKA|nr:putative FixW protein [Spironucleus salmonicida]|eukprot:EST46475.1 hypothetical protein SS50377_13557 [Spironucleus salmonicida]